MLTLVSPYKISYKRAVVDGLPSVIGKLSTKSDLFRRSNERSLSVGPAKFHGGTMSGLQ